MRRIRGSNILDPTKVRANCENHMTATGEVETNNVQAEMESRETLLGNAGIRMYESREKGMSERKDGKIGRGGTKDSSCRFEWIFKGASSRNRAK